MSKCNYSGCGHEGKIDGLCLCAKHFTLMEKASGKIASEELETEKQKPAADVLMPSYDEAVEITWQEVIAAQKLFDKTKEKYIRLILQTRDV